MYFRKLNPKSQKYIHGANKIHKYSYLRKWLYFSDIRTRPEKYIHFTPEAQNLGVPVNQPLSHIDAPGEVEIHSFPDTYLQGLCLYPR